MTTKAAVAKTRNMGGGYGDTEEVKRTEAQQVLEVNKTAKEEKIKGHNKE